MIRQKKNAENICNLGKEGSIFMAQTKIKLNAVEDATELVQAAEKCDFDIDLANGRAIVDAKSLLGVISLGTGNILVVQCHGENQDFNKTVQKFAVA